MAGAPAKKVKAPAALLLAIGKGHADSEDAGDEADDLPEDFEDYAVTAFPELEGKPDRLMALHKAMKSCM